jgi:hypothetical protein
LNILKKYRIIYKGGKVKYSILIRKVSNSALETAGDKKVNINALKGGHYEVEKIS